MARTSEIVNIAAGQFGLAESTVSEVVRRIRENDLFVRETKSPRSPRPSARHVANLIVALLSGQSTRNAAEAVRRADNSLVNDEDIRKYWRIDANYFLAEPQWRCLVIDDEWRRKTAGQDNRAPLSWLTAERHAERGYALSFTDFIEMMIGALHREPVLLQEIGASRISYDPDRNAACVSLVLSTFDVHAGQYMARLPVGGKELPQPELEFSDHLADFQSPVQRSTEIGLQTLNLFARAIARGEREG